MRTLMSPRGKPLVLTDDLPSVPVLTVELYTKWYGLYLVDPSGKIEELSFPEDLGSGPTGIMPYCDHVPNPEVVLRFAKAHGYQLDELAAELLVGRWEIEVRGRWFCDRL